MSERDKIIRETMERILAPYNHGPSEATIEASRAAQREAEFHEKQHREAVAGSPERHSPADDRRTPAQIEADLAAAIRRNARLGA